MDFSGIGMTLVSCCFMSLVPPIPAGIAFFVIHTVRKRQARPIDDSHEIALFALLYILSFVASCLFIYFSYLQYMYVM